MSSRGNLHPWFVVGIGLLLFVVLPVVRKVTGSVPRVDPIEGTWVGPVRLSSQSFSFQHSGGSGVIEEGYLFVTLKAHENMPAYYDGEGEISISPNRTVHELRAFNFTRDSQNALHISFNFARDEHDVVGQSASFTGRMNKDSMQFYAGDQSRPIVSIELHRGTKEEFRQTEHNR